MKKGGEGRDWSLVTGVVEEKGERKKRQKSAEFYLLKGQNTACPALRCDTGVTHSVRSSRSRDRCTRMLSLSPPTTSTSNSS